MKESCNWLLLVSHLGARNPLRASISELRFFKNISLFLNYLPFIVGQRSPGRLDTLQGRSLKDVGAGCSHVSKDELAGRRPAWLNRELWLRKKRSIYVLWKKEQATLEDYKDIRRLCSKKVRRAEALASAVKDIKKLL